MPSRWLESKVAKGPATKKFEFVSPAAKRAYLALQKEIQYQFGVDLNAVQQGKGPFSDHKVLTESVGPGAIELIERRSEGDVHRSQTIQELNARVEAEAKVAKASARKPK